MMPIPIMRRLRRTRAGRWLCKWYGRLDLFAAIVFRPVSTPYPGESKVPRLDAKTAWEVACIVWD